MHIHKYIQLNIYYYFIFRDTPFAVSRHFLKKKIYIRQKQLQGETVFDHLLVLLRTTEQSCSYIFNFSSAWLCQHSYAVAGTSVVLPGPSVVHPKNAFSETIRRINTNFYGKVAICHISRAFFFFFFHFSKLWVF